MCHLLNSFFDPSISFCILLIVIFFKWKNRINILNNFYDLVIFWNLWIRKLLNHSVWNWKFFLFPPLTQSYWTVQCPVLTTKYLRSKIGLFRGLYVCYLFYFSIFYPSWVDRRGHSSKLHYFLTVPSSQLLKRILRKIGTATLWSYFANF